MNEWLTPIVEAYVQKYGTVNTPNVWEVGSRDGIDGYEIANAVQTELDDDFALIPTATENATAVWSDTDTYGPTTKGGILNFIKVLILGK